VLDPGTPETAARAARWPWADAPDADRYSSAAQEIRLAFSILSAGLFARGADPTRVNGLVGADSAGQHAAVIRYQVWRRKLVPRRALGDILDVLGNGVYAPAWQPILCRGLELYLALFPSPLDKRPESD